MFKIGDKVKVERVQENGFSWQDVGRGLVKGILYDPSTREQVAIKYRDKECIAKNIKFDEVVMINAARFRVTRWSGNV